MDQWGRLFDIATGEPEGNAVIEPTDNPGEVALTWPDGSKTGLYWHNGQWNHTEQLDTAPCDVAARDTL
jgi:hypothetical protein